MASLLSNIGSLTGFLGILICLVAGVTRLTGSYYLAGYGLQSLLLAGIGLLLVGCFLKLEALTRE
jgi:hypothetical protein